MFYVSAQIDQLSENVWKECFGIGTDVESTV